VIEYIGTRSPEGAVTVKVVEPGRRARALPRYRSVWNHSPNGFEWSYGGSGPAQLALALCIDALDRDIPRALRIYQNFKFRHVAGFQKDNWSMTKDAVLAAIQTLERERTPAE
jgi:hypothetical protein